MHPGMYAKMALRDVGIVLAASLAWKYGAHLSAGAGPVADATGVLLGLALGVCAFVAHEWGHFLGALAGGAVVHAPRGLASVYLFSFDSKRNSRRQFLIMSFAGFAVTGAAVWGTQALLPDGLLATRVARGAILFLASLTVLFEIPLVLWAVLVGSLPPVETFAHRAEDEPGGTLTTKVRTVALDVASGASPSRRDPEGFPR